MIDFSGVRERCVRNMRVHNLFIWYDQVKFGCRVNPKLFKVRCPVIFTPSSTNSIGPALSMLYVLPNTHIWVFSKFSFIPFRFIHSKMAWRSVFSCSNLICTSLGLMWVMKRKHRWNASFVGKGFQNNPTYPLIFAPKCLQWRKQRWCKSENSAAIFARNDFSIHVTSKYTWGLTRQNSPSFATSAKGHSLTTVLWQTTKESI